MTETAKVILRPVNLEDKNFIMSSWLHNQYWSSLYFQNINQDTFFDEYAKHIAKLLSNPDAKIDVAVLDTEPDIILGFICYLPSAIHWCYVKKEYRRKGIMKLLLTDKTPRHYTGTTAAGHGIAKKLNLTFNPFIT